MEFLSCLITNLTTQTIGIKADHMDITAFCGKELTGIR